MVCAPRRSSRARATPPAARRAPAGNPAGAAPRSDSRRPVRGWSKASRRRAAPGARSRPRRARRARPALRASRRVPPYDASPSSGWPGLGEVDPDLVRAAGVERHLGERRVLPPNRSTTRHSVSARRVADLEPPGEPRPVARVPAVGRVEPARLRRARRGRARGRPSRPSAPSTAPGDRASAASVRATTRQPEVSLSSRWTRPSRGRSAAGSARPSAVQERVHDGRVRAPARRVDHHPGGLVEHDEVARPRSSTASGRSCATRAGRLRRLELHLDRARRRAAARRPSPGARRAGRGRPRRAAARASG